MAFDQLKVEVCDWWGKDRDIAHAAWASTYDQRVLAAKTPEDVRRVVTDVVALDHGTPKERVWLDVFITCPIFIERQFDKYRLTVQFQGFEVEFWVAEMGRENTTQNELSGRYRTIPDRPYDLPDDVALVVAKALEAYDPGEPFLPSDIREDFAAELQRQHRWYQQQLLILKKARDESKVITGAEYKRSREVLRGVLGTAFLTDMRILMNLHSFENIINQRLPPAAQLEGRVVAGRLLQRVRAKGVAPVAIEEMVRANGWDEHLEELKEVL